jgi:hypothetical protein
VIAGVGSGVRLKTDVNPDGNADAGTDTGTVDGGEHASNNKALS